MSKRAIKTGLILFVLTALLPTSEVLSEYKVLLKSKESLFAEDYWIDKVDPSIIRLLIQGKNERYPREDIFYIAPRSLEDIDVKTVIKRLTFASRTESTGIEVQAPVATEEKTPTANPAEPTQQSAPLPQEQQEANALDANRERAKDAYRETLANGDLKARQKAREEIIQLTDEWKNLTERIKDAHEGELPDWWRW